MALHKEFHWKGFNPNHWHLIDRKTVPGSDTGGLTVCVFAAWKDKETYLRQTDKSKRGFMLPIMVMFSFAGELSQRECYEMAKTTELTLEGIPNPLLGASDDL